MKIEGIPEGWELVRIGSVRHGEFYLDGNGHPVKWNSAGTSQHANYAIVRKIEKAKQYRAFANGGEFLSHPLNGGWVEISSTSFTKVSQFDEKRFWLNNEEDCFTWEDGFNLLRFLDKTPFGIEVTE